MINFLAQEAIPCAIFLFSKGSTPLTQVLYCAAEILLALYRDKVMSYIAIDGTFHVTPLTDQRRELKIS